jgi:hypothetical protein
MTTRDEREALAHFRDRYASPSVPLVDEIEAEVIGEAWGANGYTTVEQADELARRLDLRPDVSPRWVVAPRCAARSRPRVHGGSPR